MLAKVVEKGGQEWDDMLPYVMFAYRSAQQSSTHESPFYLLYGRDPRLPVPEALTPKKTPTTVDLKEYGLGLHARLVTAWALARSHVSKAQRRQKMAYDRGTKQPPFREGERVFLHKPAEQTGEARKLARPFHGPYRLLEVGPNTAKITPVNRPEEEPLLVSLARLRRCPQEVAEDQFWPTRGAKRQRRSKRAAARKNKPADPTDMESTQNSSLPNTPTPEILGTRDTTEPAVEDPDAITDKKQMVGRWAGRLRPRPGA